MLESEKDVIARLERKVRLLRELCALRGEYLAAVVERLVWEERLGERLYLEAKREEEERQKNLEKKKKEVVKLEKSVERLRESVRAYGREFQAVKEVLDMSKEEVEEYGGIRSLSDRVKGLQRANGLVRAENSALGQRLRSELADVKRARTAAREAREAERREKAKRIKLEKLCRELASEISSLRKDVRTMTAAWSALRCDVEGLKNQVGNVEPGVLTNLMELIKSGGLSDVIPSDVDFEDIVQKSLDTLGINLEATHQPAKESSEAVT